MIFQTPAYIEGIRTLKDRCLKFTVFTSRELPADQKTTLFELEQKEGWFLFKENAIKEDEIIDLPDVKLEKDEKSPSERLRSRMFVYYKENHKDTTKFNTWYVEQLDKLGQQYLDKIN